MTIDALPSAPVPTDTTAEFNTKAFALVAALNTFVGQVNTDVIAANASVSAAAANAATAGNFATTSSNASAASVAAANYKGEWSTLSGALNIPASVSYGGVIWVLKANLANVTTDTPGVSNQWLSATFSTGKAIAMSIVFGG